jgi:hypothetical protein
MAINRDTVPVCLPNCDYWQIQLARNRRLL